MLGLTPQDSPHHSTGLVESLTCAMPARPHRSPYGEEFFSGLDRSSSSSAGEIVPLLVALTRCKSVVDVGCGTGHWVRAFMDSGVLDVLGVDGDYVHERKLRVPRSAFAAWDLSRPLRLGRQFDLCLCLEVAEHLLPKCAARFVASLVSLAPVVVFSAAIPGQGGTHHVNEQWPSYWVNLFERHGFMASDCIRPRIWSNPKVAWWYAQNMLLFVSPKHDLQVEAVRLALINKRWGMIDVVHPRGRAWPWPCPAGRGP